MLQHGQQYSLTFEWLLFTPKFDLTQNTTDDSWNDHGGAQSLSGSFQRKNGELVTHWPVCTQRGVASEPPRLRFVPARDFSGPVALMLLLFPVCGALSSAVLFPVLSLSSCLSGTSSSFLFLRGGCRHFQYRQAMPAAPLAAAFPLFNPPLKLHEFPVTTVSLLWLF